MPGVAEEIHKIDTRKTAHDVISAFHPNGDLRNRHIYFLIICISEADWLA